MKPKRRWNERTRLILTLELAVVLPAAALVILSAWHLMHGMVFASYFRNVMAPRRGR